MRFLTQKRSMKFFNFDHLQTHIHTHTHQSPYIFQLFPLVLRKKPRLVNRSTRHCQLWPLTTSLSSSHTPLLPFQSFPIEALLQGQGMCVPPFSSASSHSSPMCQFMQHFPWGSSLLISLRSPSFSPPLSCSMLFYTEFTQCNHIIMCIIYC